MKNIFTRLSSNDMIVPALIALSQLVIQMIFHGNYGYFRDELYYIACSEHPAWGYVDQPPLSIAILSCARWLLGDSLQAIRFLPSVAGAGVVMLAAMMAREFGGGRFARGLAAVSVVAAHVLLGNARNFSMNAFDVFFWALACFLVVKILVNDDRRLWLAFGAVAGLGLLNKYSMGFLYAGILTGLLLTPHRKHLATKWFWLGALIAAALFLPHIIWELSYGLPTLEFMRNASQTKNLHLGVFEFIKGQFRDANFINAPVWLLGLFFFFFSSEGKRFRVLGWTYVAVFIIMIAGNAKVYYLSPIYPMLFAGGAVYIEQIIRQRSWNWMRPVYVSLLLLWAIIAVPFALPVLPVEKFIAYEKFLGVVPHADEVNSVGVLPQYYADQFGWEEMVASVATTYRTLTPEEQSQCVIYVRNYGEAAAVDFFGKKYGLPNALCAHNNYWLWGPGTRTGSIAIIIGGRRTLEDNLSDLKSRYKEVELAAVTNANYCMPFENGRQIFLCKHMNTTFQELWPEERFYI